MSTLNVCSYCLAHGETDSKGDLIRPIKHYEDCEMSFEKRKMVRNIEKFKECGVCGSFGGRDGKLKKCSGCNCVLYCSAECQKSDWTNHKLYCKLLKKIVDAK
jgi:hypothetical protein